MSGYLWVQSMPLQGYPIVSRLVIHGVKQQLSLNSGNSEGIRVGTNNMRICLIRDKHVKSFRHLTQDKIFICWLLHFYLCINQCLQLILQVIMQELQLPPCNFSYHFFLWDFLMTITTENICVTKFSRVGFQIIHSGDKVHTKLIIIHIVISIKK